MSPLRTPARPATEMDRRAFLKTTGVALAATALPARAQPMVSRLGQVVEVFRPGLTLNRDKVVTAEAHQLLDQTLMAFTGLTDPVKALGQFVDATDTVGLKVNALAAPGHPFHPAFTWRIVEHLRALGLPNERIVIYDQYGDRMRKSGYKRVTRPGKVRVISHKRVGYEKLPMMFQGNALHWTKLLRELTCILNLSVPKDHDIAGITGALKNMSFGNIKRVPGFHRVIHDAIPWIYAQPEIMDRTRLCLIDASRVMYNGGPQDHRRWRVQHDSMLIGQDPVALDWAVLELVNEQRARHKMGPVELRKKRKHERPPEYLRRAPGYGLGCTYEQLRWTRFVEGEPVPYQPRFIDPNWKTPTIGVARRRPAPP